MVGYICFIASLTSHSNERKCMIKNYINKIILTLFPINCFLTPRFVPPPVGHKTTNLYEMKKYNMFINTKTSSVICAFDGEDIQLTMKTMW